MVPKEGVGGGWAVDISTRCTAGAILGIALQKGACTHLAKRARAHTHVPYVSLVLDFNHLVLGGNIWLLLCYLAT